MELNHDFIFPATPHSRGKRAGSYFLRGPAGPMGAPGNGFNKFAKSWGVSEYSKHVQCKTDSTLGKKIHLRIY